MIDVPYEVKKALREGTYRKNYRFIVLHDDWTEDFTIDNDNLVKESVSIDERMCSGDTIKYGLCEGSSLEFQYFEKPNITGRRVQAFVDVDYEKVITQYSWETQEQFSTAFTVTDMSGDCRLYTELDSAWDFAYVTENGTTTQVYPTATESGTIIELGDVTGRTLIVSLPVIPAPTADLQLLVPHVGPAILTHPIPLGFFDVKKCSRQASTGIIKATAYNKLQSDYLDAKANDLLMENVDDSSIDLTLFSIRKTLLEQFQIEPYLFTEKEANTWQPQARTYITNSIKLSDLTTDDGPINYYDLLDVARQQGITLNTNTELRISVTSRALTWDIGPQDYDHYQLLQSGHDFSALSESFVKYLKDFIDACPLSKTGETVINEIKNNSTSTVKGWRAIFGLNYYQVSGGRTYYYNDYAYKYQNNGSYPVDGTTKDFIKRLFDGPLLTTIYEYVPTHIEVEIKKSSNSWYTAGIYSLLGEGSISYEGSGGSTKTYPKFKYEDGSDIPAYSALEGQYPFEDWFGLYKIENISNADLITMNVETMPEFTLREITSASYETQCQFGQLSRTTDLFSGVELGHSRLLPAETLYPATDLYPGGARLSGSKAMYSKLWADEGNIHKWRNLIITYKGLDEEQNEKEFTLQKQVNADGTDDYNCSDNWLFKNLVWTAEQIGEYADAMVAKMQGITWFPFEMWCAGLPYLETGDEIEIPLGDQKYVSYVLQRQLKGIQNLQDTYINGTLDIY